MQQCVGVVSTGTFTGTDRYELQSVLGRGGMGVVYRALDRSRGEIIALKTLHTARPKYLLGFKREFRSLVGLRHDNLIRLGELAQHDGAWFYTMELVEGVTFMEYARPNDTLDEERLRQALTGLVRGADAIHRAGMVHQDLKPSNVLVDQQGRPVLVDLGLVAGRGFRPQANRVVGTAAYMAPEQARGRPADPAADWYSVGCILYEALTGQPPFDHHTGLELLHHKQLHDPPRPAGPEALVTLCVRLLDRTAEHRPGYDEIVETLGPLETPRRRFDSIERFVGRDVELMQLVGALEPWSEGSCSIALVHGETGVGKSALIDHFLAELDPSVQVLRSVCHPRQTMPFAALDTFIDELCEYLAQLPPSTVSRWIPERIDLLVRAFPVLGRLDAVARRVIDDAGEGAGEQERALGEALGLLLAGIGKSVPLVLVLENSEWFDEDSARVLSVAIERASPKLLVLAALRVSHEPNAWVRRLQDAVESAGGYVDHVVLEPLAAEEADALIRAHMPEANDERIARIMARTQGNPLLIHELLRGLTAGADIEGEGRTLAELDRSRLRARTPDERDLLELLATAGAPVERPALATAAGCDLVTLGRRLAKLELTAWISRDSIGSRNGVALSHPSSAAHILTGLADSERAERHRRLAFALASTRADPESIGEHFLAGGMPRKASQHLARAARRAQSGIAFGRAANLGEKALQASDLPPANRRRLHALVADAFVGCGRSAAAASHYREAAALSEGNDHHQLRALGAEFYLRSGHVDEAMAEVNELFAVLGMSWPNSPQAHFRALLWNRLKLKLERIPAEPKRRKNQDTLPVELLWSLGMGMATIRFIAGANMQSHGLLLALRSGDRRLLARAVYAESAFAVAGSRYKRAERLMERARALAKPLDDTYLAAYDKSIAGINAMMCGRWSEARARCGEAIDIYRAECHGVSWEISVTRFFERWAAVYQGDFRSLQLHVPAALRAALELGDQFTAANLRIGFASLSWLAAGEVDFARAHAHDALLEWSDDGFFTQHWYQLMALANIDLYCGDGGAAHARLLAGWPNLERERMLLSKVLRIEMHYLRGRTALAAAIRGNLGEVRRCARVLRKQALDWPVGLSLLLGAGAAALEGNNAAAAEAADRAARLFESQDAHWFALVARLGSAVRRRDHDAQDALEGAIAKRGVADPRRFAAVFAPGLIPAPESASSSQSLDDAISVQLMRLTGHVTREALVRHHLQIEQELGDGRAALVVDMTQMTGYDPATRTRAMKWQRDNADRIVRIAWVMEDRGLRNTARTMATIARQPLRLFTSLEAAMSWARSGRLD